MFIKSKLWGVFFAGEDGGGAPPIVGGPIVVEVVPAPAGTPGAAAPAGGTLGTPPVEPKVEPKAEPKVEPKVEPKAEPKPGPKTAVEGGGGEPKVEEPVKAAERPWTEIAAEIAGDDKKLYDRLARMKGGAADVVKAWRAMEVERDSGRWAKKLPTHYTAEELAEYKKANSIPDKPDGYDINIGNGVVWGENDKPHIADFTTFALENNMTNEQVKQGLAWWAGYQERLTDGMNEADAENAALSKRDLRAKWGANEDRNKNFMKNQFEGVSKDAWSSLINSRGPDGRRIGDNPDMMITLFEKLKASDPAAYELPGNGQDVGKSLDEEMVEIKVLMKDKSGPYWRGATAGPMQARYNQLIQRREARKAQGA